MSASSCGSNVRIYISLDITVAKAQAADSRSWALGSVVTVLVYCLAGPFFSCDGRDGKCTRVTWMRTLT